MGQSNDGDRSEERYYVVGLGASAGGLSALKTLFATVPADTGLVFVVITHQPADRATMLPELLGRVTEMPVEQVDEDTAIAPNHVYTAPPGHDLIMHAGSLVPVARDRGFVHLPIDAFFRSLAQERKGRAVAVVLSGAGCDGALGLREIKAELGMVMAQEEASAEYPGMPHSAISTQLVDFVLPVEDMPERLLAYIEGAQPNRVSAKARARDALPRMLDSIRERTGHDFSHYKQAMVWRRIHRRMQVRRIEEVPAYAEHLAAHPEEIDLLFKELLIGVTSFFRDREAWEGLAAALRRVVEGLGDTEIIRAWVAGCATGEEAYSLAFLLQEILTDLARTSRVRIFATDLSQATIDVARAGLYGTGIAGDLSPERLRRHFTREDHGYRVRKHIRDMVVFASHDLIANPPLTKLNVLICRNVLIYLDDRVHERLLPIFHYALKQDGLLFLGSSEWLGQFEGLFETLDKQSRVFKRREVPSGPHVTELPADASSPARTGDAVVLERELHRAKDSHQVTIEALETANEELETSKEELRSLNDALQTANATLQAKVQEQLKANNDITNLLNGTDIATLFLDDRLCIRGFTQKATEIIRLIPSDVGRPIGDLFSSLRYDRFVQDADEVLHTLVAKEREVQADNGATYLMRILPYRTTDNVIEGLVFTFVDTTELEGMQREQQRLLLALRGAAVSVYRQDRALRIAWGWGRPNDLAPEDLVGKTDRDIFGEDVAHLLGVLKREVIASGHARHERLVLELDGNPTDCDLYVEPEVGPDGRVEMLSTVMVER